MEFVKSENLKILINYIAEKFADKLKDIKYVETGASLLAKHEQHQEKLNRKVDLSVELQNGATIGQKRKPAVDDDESYFDQDSDDEEPTAPSAVLPVSDKSPPRSVDVSYISPFPVRFFPLGVVSAFLVTGKADSNAASLT